MSLLADMIKIYDDNLEHVGKIEKATLLPLFYNAVKVFYEITIDKNGNFLRAQSLGKGELRPIPGTVDSASRSGASVRPYLITDTLQYVAGDLKERLPDEQKIDKKTGFSGYDIYLKQLKEICESEYACDELNAIYSYVKRGTIINDLFADGVLTTKDELKGSLKTAISFEVEGFDKIEENTNVIKAWQGFYGKIIANGKLDIDYVTGELKPVIGNSYHPQKVLNNGDKSKMISSNNSAIFKGRFLSDEESLSVSYETSQKAFLALRWVIAKQGISIGTRKYVIYSGDSPVVNPISDNALKFIERLGNQALSDTSGQTAYFFYRNLVNNLGDNNLNNEKIILAVLDSIGNQGRTEIIDYRNMDVQDYYDKLATWYDKTNNSYSEGLSNLYVLAKEAYTEGIDDAVIASQVTQLFSCILDDREISKPFMYQLVRKSIIDQLEHGGRLSHLLNDTASIVKARYYGNEGNILLDKENTDRSYLFGRLLAVAHKAEQDVTGRNITNATRYMTRFSQRPADTWQTIYLKVSQAYLAQLEKPFAVRYEKLFTEISEKLTAEKMNNKALSPLFVLGYQQQLGDLWSKKTDKGKEE